MPPQKKARWWTQLHWLFLLPIPVLWCVLDHYRALAFVENKTVDWRFQYRGELDSPVKVVYVDVGSLSLSQIGGWPWSRAYFAKMASTLITEGHAKAVGFDFVFSDEGVSESVDLKKLVQGNSAFGTFLYKEPPVVLAAAYAGQTFLDVNGHEQERTLPLVASDKRKLAEMERPEVPAFQRSLTQRVFYNPPFIGLIDTIDNGTRLVPAWAPNDIGRPYYHLALQLARLYWGLPPAALKVKDDSIDFVRADGNVVASVPLRDHQLLEINWFTHWTSPCDKHFEFSALDQVIDALKDGDAEEKQAVRELLADFQDAVVLIGPTDPLFQDMAPTSLDVHSVPKVSVHGNLLKTIVSGQYLHRLPQVRNVAWADYAIVLALTGLVTALALSAATRSWRSIATKLTAAAVLLAYVGFTFEIFRRSHLILPFTAPLGAAFTTSFAGLIWQVVQEQKAKGRIKGMFGTYLAPTVVDQMIESGKNPELGGHDSEITAYFSDIQSFSSFSEVMPSSQLGELLNEFLTACTDIVQEERGTLDKYIGDAVVAMFGAPVDAPDHAFRACVASQLVQRRIGELREKWRREGEKWPALVHNLRTRIGLNTGTCMIGNMGSRTRFNYTMMGDNVNLAARMESGAKSWGVYTMCTESTKLACLQHDRDRLVFRALGRIVVKGRSQPVPIHEIVGFKEDVPDSARECIDRFEAALARYYARDWDGSLGLLEQSRELEPNQPGRSGGIVSNPSLVYAKIVLAAKAEPPPPDWDGRYVMHEK